MESKCTVNYIHLATLVFIAVELIDYLLYTSIAMSSRAEVKETFVSGTESMMTIQKPSVPGRKHSQSHKRYVFLFVLLF